MTSSFTSSPVPLNIPVCGFDQELNSMRTPRRTLKARDAKHVAPRESAADVRLNVETFNSERRDSSTARLDCCGRRRTGCTTRWPRRLVLRSSSDSPRCRSIATFRRSPGTLKERDLMGTSLARRLRRRLESRIGRMRISVPGWRHGASTASAPRPSAGQTRRNGSSFPSKNDRGGRSTTASRHPRSPHSGRCLRSL